MGDSQIDKQGTEEFRSPTEKKAERKTSHDARSFPGNTRDDFTLISCEVCHSAKKAERKTKLDSGCSLQAEKGRKNTAVVKQEKRDAWTNSAPRSDALNQTDPIERVL